MPSCWRCTGRASGSAKTAFASDQCIVSGGIRREFSWGEKHKLLSFALWTLLWYVIGNTSTLLVLSLSLLSTWNPPIEETKTADPPPRDSKRGTQAWNGLQIKIDNFQWWGKWYENQSIYNAFQVISDKYYFCYLESFSHLEEEKGCFHIDFKYLVPRLGKHNIGLPKIFCKNSLS